LKKIQIPQDLGDEIGCKSPWGKPFFLCQVVFIPEKYQENHEEMVKLCKIHK